MTDSPRNTSLRALVELGLLALAVPLFFLAHAFDVLEAKRAVLLVFGGVLVVRVALGGSDLTRARLPVPLLLIAVVALLGTPGWCPPDLGSPQTWLGLKQQLSLLVLVAVGVVVQQTSWGRERSFVAMITIPAVLVATYAVAQATGREPFYELPNGTTPVATFGNGNALGEYLAPVTVLVLVLCGAASGPAAWLYGITGVLLAAAVIETQSRGAVLAVISGVSVAVLARPRPGQTGVALGRAATAIVLGACVSVLASGAHVLAFKPLRNVEASIFSSHYPTNAYRLALYEGSLELAQHMPLFGSGAGSFRTSLSQSISHARNQPGSWAAALNELQPDSVIEEPHQDLSWLAVERGLPAALLFAVAALLTLAATLRAGGTNADSRDVVRIAAGAGACAFFVNGLVRTCLWNPGATLVAFVMMGLLLAPDAEVFERPFSRLRSIALLLLLGAPAIVVGGMTLASQLLFARVGKIAAGDVQIDVERVDALLTQAASLDPSDYHIRATQLRQVLVPWLESGVAPPATYQRAQVLIDWLLAVQPGSRPIRQVERGLHASAPQDAASLDQQPSVGRAEQLIEQGKTEAAKRMLDRVLQKEDGNADALRAMYLALDREGDQNEASEYMRRAQLAYAYEFIMQGKRDDATRALRLARTYGEGAGEAWMLEALMLALRRDLAGAAAVLESAPTLKLAQAPRWMHTAVEPLMREPKLRAHFEH